MKPSNKVEWADRGSIPENAPVSIRHKECDGKLELPSRPTLASKTLLKELLEPMYCESSGRFGG